MHGSGVGVGVGLGVGLAVGVSVGVGVGVGSPVGVGLGSVPQGAAGVAELRGPGGPAVKSAALTSVSAQP
ncbi:hypothetical protein GCM10007964_39510 [Sphaerisporangium melleum]|uniref:Uncharacterized protein n=1 Tax=Sphaerisporangium melleum TaxID=321316 RepID=A0A917R7D1_9ACTN|nr:hypothetical protein GCM10007964_39510 [Sphaerisporangium melleum]